MRFPYFAAAALLATAIAAGCSGSTTSKRPDAGSTTSSGSTGGSGSCDTTADCGAGSFCIQNHCGTCNSTLHPIQCPVGTFCSQSGDCLVVGGSGSTGTSGSGSTSGTSGSQGCTHRSDCPSAQACINGVCGAPTADAGCGSNDDCVKAYICQQSTCVYGCQHDNDCHGTALPVCIAGNPGHCGACTNSSQCASNENCASNGQCVAKTACTSADTCSGLGCVGGFCSPCTTQSDCSGGNQCDTATGRCVTGSAGCSGDQQCQSQHNGSPAWYCADLPDGGASLCRLGCVDDSLCATPQTGCCNTAAGQTCNTATHACVTNPTTTATTTTTSTTGGTTATTTTTTTNSTTGGNTTGSCAGFDCQTCFDNGQSCDSTNCVCTGQATTGTGNTTGQTFGGLTGGLTTGGIDCSQTGAEGQPCGDDCSCNSGLHCTDGDSTYSCSNPIFCGDAFTCEASLQACSLGAPIVTCQP
jgi:hypothetical protein